LKVEVKFVGGKVGSGEKVFFLHLPLATKLEHSIGHQALDIPSPPFFFSLKGRFESLGALSFPKHNFQFNLEYLFPQAS